MKVSPRSVFLSASPADAAFVARLAADLAQRQVTLCNQPVRSPEALHQTPEQEEALRQAIRAAQVVLLVVSGHTSTSQIVREHLRIADIYKRPVVRVLVAGEEQQSETVPLAAELTPLIDAREERYGRALEEIMASLEPERAGVSLVESPLAAPAAAPGKTRAISLGERASLRS